MSQTQPKHIHFLQLIEENYFSFNDDSNWTKEVRLSSIDRTEFSLIQRWVTLNEGSLHFLNWSERTVSRSEMILTRGKYLQFLQLVWENSRSSNDKSNSQSPTDYSLFDRARGPFWHDLQNDLVENHLVGSLQRKFWRSWKAWQYVFSTRCGASLLSIISPSYLLFNDVTMRKRAIQKNGSNNNNYDPTHVEVTSHGKKWLSVWNPTAFVGMGAKPSLDERPSYQSSCSKRWNFRCFSKTAFYSNSELYSKWNRSFLIWFPCDLLVEPSARIYSSLATDYTKCRNQITSPFGFHADHGGFFCYSTKDSTQRLWNLVCPISWTKFIFPASKYLRKTCFRRSRFLLVPGLPMSFEENAPRIRVPLVWKPPRNPIPVKSVCIGCLATILIRGKRTPDSSSPCLETPAEPHSGEIRVYRLPSNHSHSRQTDPGFEFPMPENPLGTPFR